MITIIGNWKMAPEKQSQAIALAKASGALAKAHKKHVAIAVCPPAVHVQSVARLKIAALGLGGQSVSGNPAIAQTGLMSAAMLRDAKAGYCLVGHSESRARGETNEAVVASTKELLAKNIQPVVCIGEKERDTHGWYLGVIKEQVESVIAATPKPLLKRLMFAYEPVWAIGSQAVREATPEECREIITYIRKLIADMVGDKVAAAMPILYGGSVNPQNAASFIDDGMANGLLVGRVSLDVKAFGALAKSLVPAVPHGSKNAKKAKK